MSSYNVHVNVYVSEYVCMRDNCQKSIETHIHSKLLDHVNMTEHHLNLDELKRYKSNEHLTNESASTDVVVINVKCQIRMNIVHKSTIVYDSFFQFQLTFITAWLVLITHLFNFFCR